MLSLDLPSFKVVVVSFNLVIISTDCTVRSGSSDWGELNDENIFEDVDPPSAFLCKMQVTKYITKSKNTRDSMM